MTSAESFIEVDSCQRAKHGQFISGDVFLSRKVKQEGRMSLFFPMDWAAA